MSRPLIADIDLDALRHNYRLAAGLAPGSLSVAVLKADAYGHGAVACGRALSGEAPMFAVAAIEEAVNMELFKPIQRIRYKEATHMLTA